MEEYKPLNQDDDQLEEPQPYPLAKKTHRLLPHWTLWFTGGFLSALITVMIAVTLYWATHKKGSPGLIPDCERLSLAYLR